MMRIALLIALFTLNSGVVYAVDVPLTCADRKSFELRISNVIDGCYEEEVSLGAGPLPISNLPKYELDETLEFRFLHRLRYHITRWDLQLMLITPAIQVLQNG
jgi:hypothetical protein